MTTMVATAGSNAMIENGTCAVCRTIWDEYAEAVHGHLKTVGQLQVAKIQQNSSVSTDLEPLVLAASIRRESARRAYHNHAATHVGEDAQQDGDQNISPVQCLKPR